MVSRLTQNHPNRNQWYLGTFAHEVGGSRLLRFPRQKYTVHTWNAVPKNKVRILHSPPDHSIVPFCAFTLCLRKSGQSPRCQGTHLRIANRLGFGHVRPHLHELTPFSSSQEYAPCMGHLPKRRISRLLYLSFWLYTQYIQSSVPENKIQKSKQVSWESMGFGILCVVACIGNLWQHHFGSWKEVNPKHGAERPMLGAIIQGNPIQRSEHIRTNMIVLPMKSLMDSTG